MYPPPQGLHMDIDAVSGICGSISIACWIVVFSPQIIENFRRQSADGLSLLFLVVWLAGDVFNILGAILQGVLPTMVILAFYYTLADIVLLGQCFYYRGFTFSDAPTKPAESTTPPSTEAPDESSALLGARRRSSSSFPNLDSAHHLSPATPLIDASKPGDPPATRPASTFQTFLSNTIALSLVCLAGVFGWWLSTPRHPSHGSTQDTSTEDLAFSVPGQIFGYLCAALYLGSRVPQILLNYRRKSTDGVSLLFFLFACVGNLTYVLSILAYAPVCRRGRDCGASELRLLYGRYILVNASWLLGSLGTLLLDLAIFVQFFLYRSSETASADH